MPADRSLTLKQQQFVNEYLIDGNATAAAQRAGFKQPHVQGPRLLGNVRIQAALQIAIGERARRTEVTADRVLREYADLAFNDLRDIFLTESDGRLLLRPVREWPESIGRSLAAIKVRRNLEKADDGDGFTEVETLEFKLWSKTDALEKLAKHLGLLKDGLPLTPDGKAVAVQIVEAVRPDSRAPTEAATTDASADQ